MVRLNLVLLSQQNWRNKISWKFDYKTDNGISEFGNSYNTDYISFNFGGPMPILGENLISSHQEI